MANDNGKFLPRVTEPDAGLVHYIGPSILGNVTLCGLTDFLDHRKPGKPTKSACTCQGCLGTVRFILDALPSTHVSARATKDTPHD